MQSQKKKETLYTERTNTQNGTIELKISEPVVKRLLWIKQNFSTAIDAVTRVLSAYEDEDAAAGKLSAAVSSVYAIVTAYLRPLTELAKDYFRIPKHLRPTTITIPASPQAETCKHIA